MTADVLVSLVAISMALLLAWRGLASRNLGRGKLVRMALIWAAILIVVALAFASLGAD